MAGDDPARLRSQELPPCLGGAKRRGLDPRSLQDRPDSAGRDPDTEPGKLTLDPQVAPTRVLARQLRDQRPQIGADCGPARRPMRIGPTSRHEGAVPATNRLRPHKQTAAPVTRKHSSQRSDNHPINRAATRPGDLAAEHRKFVTQNEYLDLVRAV